MLKLRKYNNQIVKSQLDIKAIPPFLKRHLIHLISAYIPTPYSRP
jgi:hypothetical protein